LRYGQKTGRNIPGERGGVSPPVRSAANFAVFGFAVMVFAMMYMLGFELPPPPQ